MIRPLLAIFILILLGLLLIIGIFLIVWDAVRSTPGSEDVKSLNSQGFIYHYEQTWVSSGFKATEQCRSG